MPVLKLSNINKYSSLMVLFVCVIIYSCSSSPSDKNTSLVLEKDSSFNDKKHHDSVHTLNMDEVIKEYDLNRVDRLEVGDVNGDGIQDSAFIQPLTYYINNNKIDSQFVTINFSCSIPSIKHYDGFQGLIVNVGDLDGNRTEEILYYPLWYQSNWGGIHIYGYQNNRWVLLGSAPINRSYVNDKEDYLKYLKSRVKKINNYSFELIQHSVNTYDGSVFDSTIVVTIK